MTCPFNFNDVVDNIEFDYLGVDIKQWTNCRVGMLGWAILSLNFALVSIEVDLRACQFERSDRHELFIPLRNMQT